MKILTSLSPKINDIQYAVINSWKKLGFEIISFNHPSEISTLISEFKKDVTFIETSNTAIELCDIHKPYVSIDEILNYAFQQYEPTWIINADIFLHTNRSTIERLQVLAQDTIIFGYRIDVDNYTIPFNNPTIYYDGFDYFIISKKFDHLFISNKSKMFMGQPWWDYWIPLTCIRKNIIPILYNGNIAYHVRHPTNWNIDQWLKFGKILAANIGLLNLTNDDINILGQMTIETIRRQSYKLTEQTLWQNL